MEKLAVMGLGKVGGFAAELLAAGGFQVTGYDAVAPDRDWPFAVKRMDIGDRDSLPAVMADNDAVLSCLPWHLNRDLAAAAHKAGIHYFDLTEDVETTRAIRAMADTARGLLAPQCGLAPGFVGMVAADLIGALDSCRSCRMRVGALPQHPTGLLGYAFNWSPEGVVNEYLNDCEVIEAGQRKWVSPMEWVEKIVIGGIELEAFTTSGGLGTMCETFLGRVPDLDYKSMRYPGHVRLMNFFFHELLMRDRRAEAGHILVHAKPPVEEDVVYIHVAAEGQIDGRIARREFVRAYKPREIAGRRCTAIAWTTASSVAAVIDMVRKGVLPRQGFLKQEDIPLAAFLAAEDGRRFALDG